MVLIIIRLPGQGFEHHPFPFIIEEPRRMRGAAERQNPPGIHLLLGFKKKDLARQKYAQRPVKQPNLSFYGVYCSTNRVLGTRFRT